MKITELLTELEGVNYELGFRDAEKRNTDYLVKQRTKLRKQISEYEPTTGTVKLPGHLVFDNTEERTSQLKRHINRLINYCESLQAQITELKESTVKAVKREYGE